jgi:CheY-like chemotaxis protein
MGEGKGTILIVDDEFAIVETLQELLEEVGYRVRAANHGVEGLAQLSEERPDLILTDVMMPLMGGIEMLHAIRADTANRDIPVIVMSSAPRLPAVIEGQAAGEIAAFLRKPFELATLLAMIERLLHPAAPD